ncbi:dihydrofolate reductase family protein [Xanthovirga aplysinae]|uniref:dihydrofolate reductase family protein n=1 Tax=Xanthovirga aplysinae TaxID=2529853 RepID=UPI0012BCF0DD|nr:dihydrofolate reductase family protein [Xanthovirga aplysinae]MTI33099.1 dihydrofolate reductase [Xanthovirga aplysinae]
MDKKNMVFIARSLDGYISDRNGGLDWLNVIPNPEHEDAGYGKFIKQMDALIMGRRTFETVCGFDGDWPYPNPVFVLSKTLMAIPEEFKDKAELVKGSLGEILDQIHQNGYHRLYIDGGATIQSFLREDLIDDLIITTIPVLLGGGAPLFSELPKELEFEHVGTEVFLNELVQSHYKRKN